MHDPLAVTGYALLAISMFLFQFGGFQCRLILETKFRTKRELLAALLKLMARSFRLKLTNSPVPENDSLAKWFRVMGVGAWGLVVSLGIIIYWGAKINGML